MSVQKIIRSWWVEYSHWKLPDFNTCRRLDFQPFFKSFNSTHLADPAVCFFRHIFYFIIKQVFRLATEFDMDSAVYRQIVDFVHSQPYLKRLSSLEERFPK